jgi:hypothetical protein
MNRDPPKADKSPLRSDKLAAGNALAVQFNNDIIRGLLRRKPDLDIVLIQPATTIRTLNFIGDAVISTNIKERINNE